MFQTAVDPSTFAIHNFMSAFCAKIQITVGVIDNYRFWHPVRFFIFRIAVISRISLRVGATVFSGGWFTLKNECFQRDFEIFHFIVFLFYYLFVMKSSSENAVLCAHLLLDLDFLFEMHVFVLKVETNV
jgi:hypothetical protein